MNALEQELRSKGVESIGVEADVTRSAADNAPVTRKSVAEAFRIAMHGIIFDRIAPLAARVGALEKRGAGGGVTIHAEGITMATPLDPIVNALEEVKQVLSSPVVPELDEHGRLVGARRKAVEPSGAAPHAVTHSVLANVLERAGVAVREALDARLSKFESRIAALEAKAPGDATGNSKAFDALVARLDALEARPALAYAGTWSHETEGKAGYFYTDKGAIWYCRRGGTHDRPGDSDAYQLACKSGRDGKDLR